MSLRTQGAALGVALVGIVALAFGLTSDLAAVTRAYFAALMVVWQLPLGCLALLIAYHLMGGRWGLAIGDALEAGVRTLPLFALLFLPVLLDLPALFPWTRPDFVAEHPTVGAKLAWLSPGFFSLRAVIYLLVWLALGFALTGAGRPFADRPRRRQLAIVAAILYALSASFASIDWLMSLDPRFTSSIFGMLAMSGQAVAGLTLALLTSLCLGARHDHRPDAGRLGSLLLALVLLWIYFAFIQLLIAWSGDLPADAAWYLARTEDGWRVAVWILGVGHAALPVLILLSARVRHSWLVLIGLAGLLLAMRVLDLLWLTLPGFAAPAVPAWLVAGAVAAVGGLWLAAFGWLIAGRAAWVARAVEDTGDG
jgi:hypothetical protein